MLRKYLLPVIALVGFLYAVQTVLKQSQPVIAAPPVAPAAQSSYQDFVAGAGIVEAMTENIAVGTPTPGLVTEVLAQVGAKVAKGDALFKLDDRTQQAELAARLAALDASKAALARLKSMPRPEEIPLAEARVKQAEVQLADTKNSLSMREGVSDKRAISEEQIRNSRFAVEAAQAKVKEAQADLALLKAGAWAPEIAVAEAEVKSAQAQVEAVQTEIDRLTVKAPVDGEVLQVKIRVGEFAQAGPLATPLMVVGNVDTLHVRVDVDEHDAWRIEQGSPAEAYVRGNSSLKTTLSFVRFEPYVVPKKSLTGDSTERVDTRVLQVIYSFDPKSIPIYVGQQVDVFIKGKPSLGAPSSAPAPATEPAKGA